MKWDHFIAVMQDPEVARSLQRGDPREPSPARER